MSEKLFDRPSSRPPKPRVMPVPLPDVLKGSDFIPQAVVRKSLEALAGSDAQVFSGTDDLDDYRGLGFRFGDVAFTIMHYKGHPPETSTIYLPHEMRDLQPIDALLKAILSHFKLRTRDIVWQRKDDLSL
jgi:hypothetical protein